MHAATDAPTADAPDPGPAADGPDAPDADASGDALWTAVTWHAFVDGLLSRSAGHDHNMGAYTVLAAPGLEDEDLAFDAAPTRDVQGTGEGPPPSR